ncbi:MAG: hypothetical protein AABX38_04610 [Candidatus Micrarchaeota archaeon]
MELFIDKIEGVVTQIQQKEQKLQVLNEKYKKLLDKDLRNEINELKQGINQDRLHIRKIVFYGIQEISLIKKYFPEFFKLLCEYEVIGKVISAKEWLLELPNYDKKNGQKELILIRQQRKEAKQAKETLLKWVGQIDPKAIGATWPFLKNKIGPREQAEDILEKVSQEEKELRRKGWAILLSDEFILDTFKKNLIRLEKLRGKLFEVKKACEKSSGKGTIAEYDAKKDYEEAEKNYKKIETFCNEILLSNPQFLLKIKSDQTIYSKDQTRIQITNFISKLKIQKINLKNWKEQMRIRIKNA